MSVTFATSRVAVVSFAVAVLVGVHAAVASGSFPESAWNVFTASRHLPPIPYAGNTIFAATWQRVGQQRCGAPTGSIWHDRSGWHQRFQRCTMSLPNVTIRPIPPAVPTPSRAVTSACTPDCGVALLAMLNAARAGFRVAPLALSRLQSGGNRSCLGAVGHSRHMAIQGYISHDDFPKDVCVLHGTAGENVGVMNNETQVEALRALTRLMMAEGTPKPGCTGSHACNIINPAFHSVGIGIYVTGRTTWLTEDFTGP